MPKVEKIYEIYRCKNIHSTYFDSSIEDTDSVELSKRSELAAVRVKYGNMTIGWLVRSLVG